MLTRAFRSLYRTNRALRSLYRTNRALRSLYRTNRALRSLYRTNGLLHTQHVLKTYVIAIALPYESGIAIALPYESGVAIALPRAVKTYNVITCGYESMNYTVSTTYPSRTNSALHDGKWRITATSRPGESNLVKTVGVTKRQKVKIKIRSMTQAKWFFLTRALCFYIPAPSFICFDEHN